MKKIIKHVKNKYCSFAATSLLGLAILASNPASALDLKYDGKQKISSNMFSLMLQGDINASYEKAVSNQFSLLSTIHYMTPTEGKSLTGNKFRASIGGRAYQSSELSGLFLEMQGGVGYYGTLNGEQKTGKYGSPGVEIYTGLSQKFNDNLFYEYKFGVVRLLDKGKLLPTAGLNVGISF